MNDYGTVGDEIRGMHPYHFRSGARARIVAIAEDPESGRMAYLVEFPDLVTDFWVVDDAVAEYEFRMVTDA